MTITFDFPRPSENDVTILAGFSAATIHEAIGQKGALPSTIKPICAGMRVCGPALTIECPPEASRERIEREAAMVEKIKAGASTMDLLNLHPALKNLDAS